MRPSKRRNDELREISVTLDVLNHAEGSCMIKFGGTHVICSATVEESLPPFLRYKNLGGWVTAEYSMLPRSVNSRIKREVNQGKPSGRTQEIQRLIGRSLRSCVDLMELGERQVIIDCDVINADGGTRTAAITGGYIALNLAISNLMKKRVLKNNPLKYQVAAISCGIVNGNVVLDLDYEEDSNAEVDSNFVISSNGGIIEVQATAEKNNFTEEQFQEMMKFAKIGTSKLFSLQTKSLISNNKFLN